MSTKGVVITKGKPGANASTAKDGTTGMVLHGVATGNIALGETKVLYQLSDAEDLGLDAAYDTANAVRVYHHIKEFYRVLEKFGVTGVPLYIMLVDNSVTTGDLDVTYTAMVEDTGGVYGKKLAIDADDEIRLMGFVMNPAAGYSSTLLDGLDSDVMGAIPKAQALVDWGWANYRPFVAVLEGREFNGTAAAAQDLRNITDVEAGEVAVCILQDWDYAETQDTLGKKYADVGTLLGTLAAGLVNDNIGEVETKNLTDSTKSAFLTAGLSSHDKAKDKEADWATLDTKGYIFGLTYSGIDGVRFNDDHTCTPVVEDQDGFLSIYSLGLARTNQKAARNLRTALLPKVKSKQKLDPDTGKLSPLTVEYFNGLGNAVFDDMVGATEIIEGKTIVNPDSDLLTGDKTLEVNYSWAPYGIVGEIKGKINIKSTL